MRFMLMHKTNASNEAGLRPPEELITGVGRMIREMQETGIFRDGAGLRASSLGARLEVHGGARTVTPGPFTGKNKLPAALCVLRVRSLEEAVHWASRFAAIVEDAELDIRPLTEPWDLGLAEKPKDDPTTRYMAVYKADARYEAGALPSAEVRAATARLIAEMKQAGVFVAADALQPSARSKRIRISGGKQVVTDGPFVESKELIAGFVTLELPSIAEAVDLGRRYAPILGEEVELDVRPLFEPAELR